MKTQAQNFIFRALLIGNELEALEEAGQLTKQTASLADLDKEHPDSVSIEDFSTKIRIDAIKMAGVYMAFFGFENSVRQLVRDRMHERERDGWWSRCVSEKIKTRVEDRKGKDAKNKWHAPRASEDIAYTDFSDLSDIVITNWKNFEDLFPTQDWIKTRLGDLEQSRNAIAHNNVLAERDIQRIRMYVQDWLSQVG